MGLAAISERLGYKTKIIDAPIENIKIVQLKKILNYWKPEWVIANISLETLNSDLYSLKIAKDYGAKTVIFGYASTIQDLQIMKEASFIDFAIRREPELTFQELLEDILPLEEIEGLTFRKKNSIQRNRDRPFIQNLDILPFPSHHLIKNELYRVPITGEKFTTIQVSRGCPYKCTFCLSHLLNGFTLRKRSVINIIEEIKLVINNLQIHNFFFRADTFTADKQWVIQLCREIIKNKLKITWFCNSRVDTIDEEMLNLMKRAGCQLITFGIESGDNYILQHIRKGITKNQVKKAIDLTRHFKIFTGTFFIIGLPGDTINSIHNTIKFSKEINSDGVEFIPFVPFLGTQAINQYDNKIDPQYIRKLIRYAYFQFYFRPKIILREINNFFSVKTHGIRQILNLTIAALKTFGRLLQK